MKDDLMAVASPARYREKRSKHSRKSGVEEQVKTKDELMNILGAIRNAKHHKLTRKDIRELAKKAFARMKSKKKEKGKSDRSDGKRKDDKKTAEKKSKQKDAAKTLVEKEKKTSKTAKEDEKAFSNIFDDNAGKPKASEFAEDISKLGDSVKFSQMLSDESMTKQKNDFDTKLENLASKKSPTPKDSPTVKDPSQSMEQEINNALGTKETASKAGKKKNNSKKSTVPELGRDEKIKTLKNLLSKANKSKVPKKFLQQFPAGLRMIAWRELLEKKKKELAELEAMQEKEQVNKKSVDADEKPVTVDIDIDPNAVQPSIDATTAKDDAEDKHHISSHVKYLQKHLSSAQDLRKLISRALIGHCKATGKRILKAFVAMDKALERAQSIATVIGKKFKVDASKIENIVVNKEDEVVESFLRDIFSNFAPK